MSASLQVTSICEVPCVIRMKDLVDYTDVDENAECFFPPYPTDPNTLRAELDELIELWVCPD